MPVPGVRRPVSRWWYILDEAGDPVGPVDMVTFVNWRASVTSPLGESGVTPLLRVAFNRLDDGTIVSTVFLGLDHGFGRRDSPPILYETMVFDPSANVAGCWRDCNRHAALATHDRVLAGTKERANPK